MNNWGRKMESREWISDSAEFRKRKRRISDVLFYGYKILDKRFRGSIMGLLTFPDACPVFGIKLDYTHKTGAEYPQDNKASIARLNEYRAHKPGNIVVVSHRAGIVMNKFNREDMRKILDFMEKTRATEMLGEVSDCPDEII
jgi:hypothetical protein